MCHVQLDYIGPNLAMAGVHLLKNSLRFIMFYTPPETLVFSRDKRGFAHIVDGMGVFQIGMGFIGG